MSSDPQLDPPALSFFSSLFPPNNPPLASMAFNHTGSAFLAGQAFWGPVTATLDWCEVSTYTPACESFVMNELCVDLPNSLLPRTSGQLPVLPLHCRGREHILQPNHRCSCTIWGSAVGVRQTPASVLGRLFGTSSLTFGWAKSYATNVGLCVGWDRKLHLPRDASLRGTAYG